MPKALSDQWVAVFAGAHGLADLYAEELRAHGIPVFVPDRHIKMLDPLDFAGGNVFDISVLVPRDQEAAAREILREIQASEIRDPEFAADDARPSEAELELRKLGNRIGWCAMLPAFGPWGLWLSIGYFRARRRLPEPRPPLGLMLCVLTLCAAQTVALFVLPLRWF